MDSKIEPDMVMRWNFVLSRLILSISILPTIPLFRIMNMFADITLSKDWLEIGKELKFSSILLQKNLSLIPHRFLPEMGRQMPLIVYLRNFQEVF